MVRRGVLPDLWSKFFESDWLFCLFGVVHLDHHQLGSNCRLILHVWLLACAPQLRHFLRFLFFRAEFSSQVTIGVVMLLGTKMLGKVWQPKAQGLVILMLVITT